MSKTEELIALAQSGNDRAFEQLVIENSGLIWSIARRFLNRGVDADDLYQLGCVGFIKATQGFDLEYGTQFSTYAVPKIAGEIRRFLRDDGAVKVSRSLKEKAITVRITRTKLTQSLGREATVHEIAEETGLAPEEIALVETALTAVESIQQENGDDGFKLENILSDKQNEDSMIEKISLQQAIEKLPDREKMLIHLRYFHGLTQQRIAVVLGVSQVQVSRIEKKALMLLREIIC